TPLEQFGVILDDRFDDRVVVWRVIPGSPAFYAGFQPGDVVTTLSGQPFRTRLAFERELSAMRPGESGFQVRRGDRLRDLVVDVPQLVRTADRPVHAPVDRVQKFDSERTEQENARGPMPRVDRRY